MNRATTLEDYDLLEEAYADMMRLAGTITDVLNCLSNDTVNRPRFSGCSVV